MSETRQEAERRAAWQVIQPLLEMAHAGWRARNVVDARAAEDLRDLWRELKRGWGVA